MRQLISVSESGSGRLYTLRGVLATTLGASLLVAGCSGGDDSADSLQDIGSVTQAATLACQMGPENTNAACSDGISNDGDAYIDCNDFNCCGNGLTVCNCCGNGCGPVYPDSCSCSVACSDNSECGPGEYCWAAGNCDGDPSCFGQSGLGVGPLQILCSSTDSRRTFNHSWTDAFRNSVPLACGNSSTYGITYPAYASRIDFIEVNQQLASLLGVASVGSGAGSDHLPLSVLLDFGTPTACSTNPECDDGLFCSGAETCVAGSCQSGTDPCPGQTCDEQTNQCVATPPPGDPWINEFHYDNSGKDTGEFVEIAGPAGLDLSGFKLVGYNGSGGSSYKTVNLSGVIPSEQGCMGTLSFAFSGLQNGAPDGIALVGPGDVVLQFLSYEGDFTASGGPASGMMSVDVGVTESGSTPAGWSLRLTGTGAEPANFTWQSPATGTPGAVNQGQTLEGCG